MDYQSNFSHREEIEIYASVNNYDEPRGGNASADRNGSGSSGANKDRDEEKRKVLNNIDQEIKKLQENITDIMKKDTKWSCKDIIWHILIGINPWAFLIILFFCPDRLKALLESKFELILAYAIVYIITINFLINSRYKHKRKSADQMIKILKTMIYREKYLNKYI